MLGRHTFKGWGKTKSVNDEAKSAIGNLKLSISVLPTRHNLFLSIRAVKTTTGALNA